MPTTTTSAKVRLITAATSLGLQESVDVLSGHFQEEATRAILRTPMKDLPTTLSRILGPLSAQSFLRNTSMGELPHALSRALSGRTQVTTMAPVKPRSVRSVAPVKSLAVVGIVEKPEGFAMALSNGRTYRSTRRRDLVRRAKQLGLSIPG